MNNFGPTIRTTTRTIFGTRAREARLRSSAYRRRNCFRERLGFTRSQEAKRDALLTHLRLERVALAPRQSFLNIVLVVVLVLVLDFRDASDKPSRGVPSMRFSSPACFFSCGRSENENDDEDDDENDSRNERGGQMRIAGRVPLSPANSKRLALKGSFDSGDDRKSYPGNESSTSSSLVCLISRHPLNADYLNFSRMAAIPGIRSIR
jgi:hypothetical protein